MLEQTTGLATPADGWGLRKSAGEFSGVAKQLGSASAGARWAGSASEGYTDRNAEQQGRTKKLAALDLHLANIIDDQAQWVAHTRLGLAAVKNGLVMAMLVALALEAWERSANAATGIVNEGIELSNMARDSAETESLRRGAATDEALATIDFYENNAGPTATMEVFQGLHRRLAKRGRQYQRAVEQFEDVGRRSTRLGSGSDAIRADAAAAGCISRWFQVVACLAGLGAASGLLV
ncbi:EspA/EspE family type VII secretion system effector, partial [Mycobacterium sp. 050134]|uniref:EspA/EspE family type VII secretion system effector n=1 Tax=Mycobacterium sp. 050134 TaxID=3096111 RepID=UPI002ED8DDD3